MIIKAKKCDCCGKLMEEEEFAHVPVIYQRHEIEVDLCPDCAYTTSRCSSCGSDIIEHLEPETLESLNLPDSMPYVVHQDEEAVCLPCLLADIIGQQ